MQRIHKRLADLEAAAAEHAVHNAPPFSRDVAIIVGAIATREPWIYYRDPAGGWPPPHGWSTAVEPWRSDPEYTRRAETQLTAALGVPFAYSDLYRVCAALNTEPIQSVAAFRAAATTIQERFEQEQPTDAP
ncbi:MAG: hypothetical protein HC822_14520 [Oscillochloris sp.]|nr:hypothetical protein [Oscillochloris sp.]